MPALFYTTPFEISALLLRLVILLGSAHEKFGWVVNIASHYKKTAKSLNKRSKYLSLTSKQFN
ncbi:hypothetical protein BpHYR1_018863 [Brachionus plicatilis]|uniref:Uncharacterized protein n=1 Tax=Brachionus plicatilis TaxID=10195 RepID=A0A3M7PML1_BRAPC|nr:hypothetical protein BpHYR1_018863 [Brachionus plicatilis]